LWADGLNDDQCRFVLRLDFDGDGEYLTLRCNSMPLGVRRVSSVALTASMAVSFASAGSFLFASNRDRAVLLLIAHLKCYPFQKKIESQPSCSCIAEELKMTLTKAELVAKLHQETELDKPAAKSLVDQFFEGIKVTLENSEKVRLSGLGNFDVRDKRQRPDRNPKAGEPFPISAHRVVIFRPGPKLKAKVECYPNGLRSFVSKNCNQYKGENGR
jgi:integration host factor subunit alpha